MRVMSIKNRCKRKSRFQKMISLILLLASVSLLFSGCSSSQNGQDGKATEQAAASVPASTSSSAPASTPSSTSSKASDDETKIVQNLSSYLNQLSAEDKFSGVVLLAKDNETLFEQAYGYANHAFNALNNLNTKFNMASCGKMFTAVAIMQLIQEGKLSLDDKLIDLMPDYPNKDAASKITVQQLLTHTSGLGDIFTDAYTNSNQSQYRTLASYLPLFAKTPLQSEPGEKFSYSNAGFIVLGLIIEHVTGQDYYQYVKKNIFEPAGMVDTGFYSLSDDVSNLALGYTNHIISPIPGETDESAKASRKVAPHPEPGTSAGGVYSTLADMLRFSEALQNDKLIDAQHVDLLFAGNGIISEKENGVRIVGHSGGNNGISTSIDMYPDLGYTAIILSNYDDGARLFNQRLRWQLTGNDIPETINLSDADLKAYEGEYKPVPLSAGEATGEAKGPVIMGPAGAEPQKPTATTIKADGNGLQVNFHGNIYNFVPISATEFYDSADPSSRLTFSKDDNGQITGFNVEGGMIRQKATKQA